MHEFPSEMYRSVTDHISDIHAKLRTYILEQNLLSANQDKEALIT
jgi:UDP-N-acetylglucosamine 2-epimerase